MKKLRTLIILIGLVCLGMSLAVGQGFSNKKFGQGQSFSSYIAGEDEEGTEGPGDGEGPGFEWGNPEDIPIDGGVGFILLGGLLAGAMKIVQRVKGKRE